MIQSPSGPSRWRNVQSEIDTRPSNYFGVDLSEFR